jgi:hypothetical protein
VFRFITSPQFLPALYSWHCGLELPFRYILISYFAQHSLQQPDKMPAIQTPAATKRTMLYPLTSNDTRLRQTPIMHIAPHQNKQMPRFAPFPSQPLDPGAVSRSTRRIHWLSFHTSRRFPVPPAPFFCLERVDARLHLYIGDHILNL